MNLKDLIVPATPDYAQPFFWASLPSKTAHPRLAVDVFFSPGTMVKGEGVGYFDPCKRDHRILARRPRLVQASAFALAGNIYQPHIRQVTMEVNFLPQHEMQEAYTIAYHDVRQAFLHYWRHWNQGRPFFLVGNSQGSLLLLNLLKDALADPIMIKKLVAAYIIGFSVTKEDLATHPGLRLVEGEDDSGGIVTYNSLARNADKALTLLPGALCVNPLNWTHTEAYADHSLHLGKVDFDIDGNISRETPRFTDTWIDMSNGALKIGALNSADMESGEYFLPGDLHHYNFSFFYRNLERNACVRAKAFLNKISQ